MLLHVARMSIAICMNVARIQKARPDFFCLGWGFESQILPLYSSVSLGWEHPAKQAAREISFGSAFGSAFKFEVISTINLPLARR